MGKSLYGLTSHQRFSAQDKIDAIAVISYSSALSVLLLEQRHVLSGDLSCKKIQISQISYFYFPINFERISRDLMGLIGFTLPILIPLLKMECLTPIHFRHRQSAFQLVQLC
jgi:hypothetical protein